MTAAALRPRLDSPAWKQARLPALLLSAVLMAVGVLVTVRFPATEPVKAAMVAGVGGIAIWMFSTARYELTLVVVVLYIGLADGYLKLKTGSQMATLGRDLLLYAIVAGALVRWAIRGESVERPPLTGWVIAWIAVVLIQLANPANGTFGHSLAGVRPHLEWVPLFFLGYVTMRSKRRLQGFLLLLVIIAAINGVVSLIQFNLTPDQLANWGPGYETKITGEGDTAPRGFADEDGVLRTRPFALGGDMGWGGIVGLIAIPAALALLACGGFRVRLAVTMLSAGVVLAVVTSQARVAVVGAVLAALAFAALAVTSRGALRTVLALSLAVVVAYASVSILTSNSDQGALDRYGSIAPGEAISTTYDYRRKTLAVIPEYVRDIPLGAGLGSKGPGASIAGRGEKGAGLNAESQYTYLLIEVGIPGLLVMLGLNLKLAGLAMRRVRRLHDAQTRLFLAAVAAPLIALMIAWVVGSSTAGTPGAPYLWFGAGILAYWLIARPADVPEPAVPQNRLIEMAPPPPPTPSPVSDTARPAPTPEPAPEPDVPATAEPAKGWQELKQLRKRIRKVLGSRLG